MNEKWQVVGQDDLCMVVKNPDSLDCMIAAQDGKVIIADRATCEKIAEQRNNE